LNTGTGYRALPISLNFQRRYAYSPNIFIGLSSWTYDISTQLILLHGGSRELHSPGNQLFLEAKYITNSSSQIYSFEYQYISFCSRIIKCNLVADQIINGPDSSIAQSLYLMANFDLIRYAVILTKYSEYLNGLFVFDDSQINLPAIISVTSFSPQSLYEGITTIAPFDLNKKGTLSFHIFQLLVGDIWSIQGITNAQIFEFASNQTYTVDSALGGSEDLQQPLGDYQTIIGNKIYSSDQTDDFMCKVQITFTGILRNLYLNSQILLQGSSVDPRIPIVLTSPMKGLFKGSQLYMITFIGYRINVERLSFLDCTKVQGGIAITPKFQPYYLNQRLDHSFTLTYPTATTSCPAECLSCLNNSYCVKCQENYYISNGICVDLCTDQDYLVQSNNAICDQTVRNHALQLSPPTFNERTSQVTLKYLVDFEKTITRVLIIYSPYYPLYKNAPHPSHLMRYLPSLSEAKYIMKFITSPASPYIVQSTDTIVSAATIANPRVWVLAYSVTQSEIFTVISYSSANPNKALSVKNYAILDQSLVSTYEIFEVYFLMDCRTLCKITLKFIGYVEVFKNERTLLFSTSTRNYLEYELSHEFMDLNFILIKGSNCSSFNFTISGEYSIYTLDKFLFEDSFQIPANPCFIQDCLNCQNNKCLSCEKGYFLSEDSSSCLSSCPSSQIENSLEFKCISVASPDLVKTAEKVGVIWSTLIGVFFGLSLLIVFAGGHPTIVFKQLSLIQALLIIVFFNINYPPHLDKLLQIVTISFLKFIPNPFRWFINKLDTYDLNPPLRFIQKDIRTVFLDSGGHLVLVLLVFFGNHLLTRALSDMSKGKFKRFTIVLKDRAGLEMASRFLTSSTIAFMIPVILQLKVVVFKNSVYGISWMLCLILVILYVGLIGYIIWKNDIISKRKKGEKVRLNDSPFVLFEDYYSAENDFATPFLSYQLFKQILSVVLLITLYQLPIPQISTQLGLSVLHLLVLLLTNTFSDRAIYKLEIVTSVLRIVIEGIMIYFVLGPNNKLDTDLSRLVIGWVIFGFCGLYIVIVQGFCIFRAMMHVKGELKRLIEERRQRRLAKLNAGRGLPVKHTIENRFDDEEAIRQKLKQILKPRQTTWRPEPIGKFGLKFNNINGDPKKKRKIRTDDEIL